MLLGVDLPNALLAAMSNGSGSRSPAETAPQWLAMFASSPHFQWR
jgi:hypothetical protein